MVESEKKERKSIPPFLRRVYLSKRELSRLLNLLQEATTPEEMEEHPWKRMLIEKLQKHLEKAKEFRNKKTSTERIKDED